ncbi:MAG: prephenate dehydrogenase/arogenate dehydrogenase family protein [Nanoarchaeota archaeon]
MKKITVGIIGGTGEMGQWFKRFFENNGCEVLIAGRTTEISHEECAKKADVVVISVPIHSTLEVIKKVGPLIRKDALLMDLTSIKEEPVKAMKKYSKAEVVGTHPVFGPSVSSIKNQTMILCKGRGKKWFLWLEKILRDNQAKLKITTPKHHDEMMAVIQGVVHFSSITIAHTLKDLDISVKESQKFSSPIYKLRLDMVGRILNQDPRLYADIEILNPKAKKAIRTYINTSKILLKKIQDKDIDGFVNYFNEAADYLGDFKKEAEEYSNYLIDKLVRRKK